MTKRMDGRRLDDPRAPDRRLERPLKSSLVQQVMPRDLARPRVPRQVRGREDVLPAPLLVGARIFPGKRVGKMNPATARVQVSLMELPDLAQMNLERRLDRVRQHRHSILTPLAGQEMADALGKTRRRTER